MPVVLPERGEASRTTASAISCGSAAQFTELVTSLRRRVEKIDSELATFDALHSERSRVAAAIDALEGVGSSDTVRPAKPTRRRSQETGSRRSRARRGDTQNAVLGYLAEHPGSSASAIADAVGLKRNSTSTRLTQMAKAGLIVRSEGRGYELLAAGAEQSQEPPVDQPD